MRGAGEVRGETTFVDVTDLPAEEWDALAVRSGRGHAFQSHAWGELKRGLGWEAVRYRVDVDGAPAGVISAQVRRFGGILPGRLGRIASGPVGRLAYLYAPRGPILLGDGPGAASAALAGVQWAAKAQSAAVATIDPWWPTDGWGPEALRRAGFARTSRDVQVSRTAMIIPLDGNEADQHERLNSGTANRVNRARRAGVRVEPIDLADVHAREPALDEFYAMLAATGRRQGFLVRDRAYQLEQWRALGSAGHAYLWFAVLDDRRRCGTLCLRCGQTLLSYHAASADDADLGRTSANHLLQWEIIRWAGAAGFAAYDMGGVDAPRARGLPRDPSHPLWNLSVFKRGFGAEGVEFLPAHEIVPLAVLRPAWRLLRRIR